MIVYDPPFFPVPHSMWTAPVTRHMRVTKDLERNLFFGVFMSSDIHYRFSPGELNLHREGPQLDVKSFIRRRNS